MGAAMVRKHRITKTLPTVLTSEGFSELFDRYLEGSATKEEVTLAATARAVEHMNYIYAINKISREIFDETVAEVALNIVQLLNKNKVKLGAIKNPASYIFNITKNTVVDTYRNQIKEEVSNHLDSIAKESSATEYVDMIDSLCSIAKDDLDLQILELKTQGKTNKEIASYLLIAKTTVSLRLSKLYSVYINSQKGS